MVIYEPFKTLPLSEFHEELRFELPNLPPQVFDYYLVKTAITMAKKGNLIRRHAIIDAEPCVTRYRLESPDGMAISGIMDIRSVASCNCGSKVVTRSFAPPEGAFSCCREHAWYDDVEGVLHIAPKYLCGRFYIALAVTPKMGACTLPEAFYAEHLDTLLLGTKGSIMLITGRPWTNLQIGQGYYNEFRQRLSEDSVAVATHKMRGAVRMQFGKVM